MCCVCVCVCVCYVYIYIYHYLYIYLYLSLCARERARARARAQRDRERARARARARSLARCSPLMCACVCVCVVREREREREGGNFTWNIYCSWESLVVFCHTQIWSCHPVVWTQWQLDSKPPLVAGWCSWSRGHSKRIQSTKQSTLSLLQFSHFLYSNRSCVAKWRFVLL